MGPKCEGQKAKIACDLAEVTSWVCQDQRAGQRNPGTGVFSVTLCPSPHGHLFSWEEVYRGQVCQVSLSSLCPGATGSLVAAMAWLVLSPEQPHVPWQPFTCYLRKSWGGLNCVSAQMGKSTKGLWGHLQRVTLVLGHFLPVAMWFCSFTETVVNKTGCDQTSKWGKLLQLYLQAAWCWEEGVGKAGLQQWPHLAYWPWGVKSFDPSLFSGHDFPSDKICPVCPQFPMEMKPMLLWLLLSTHKMLKMSSKWKFPAV